MRQQTIERITWLSFVIALAAIMTGVCVGILGVWEVIPTGDDLLWRLLASDLIVFVGAVLTNLAVACYRKPGGVLA